MDGAEHQTVGARAPGVRTLSVGAQWYLVGTLVNMIGNGMLFGFLFIYFHDVRGFSSPWSGGLLSLTSIVMLVTSSFGGWCADRFGAKQSLLASVVYGAVAFSMYAGVRGLLSAVIVCVLTGIAQGVMTPAQSAFSSVIVRADQRALISSWNRIALNIGAAIGIAGAGFFLDTDRPWTFVVMFVGNGATFVAYAFIVTLVHPVTAPPLRETHEDDGGFRAVFADGFFVRLLPLDLAAGLMFGLVFLVMPTTFLKRLGADETMVGLVATSGAVIVIATQLGVAKVIRGRSRMHAMTAMFLLFSAGFVFGERSVGRPLLVAAWLVTAAQCVAGIGEACLGPTRGPLTADIAPPRLLGRYFGLQMMMFHGGFGLASGIAGITLDLSLRGTWLGGFIVAAFAAAWAMRLDRLVPLHARISP